MQDVFQNCFIVLSKRVANAGPIAKHVRLKVKHLCKVVGAFNIISSVQRKSRFFWNRCFFVLFFFGQFLKSGRQNHP